MPTTRQKTSHAAAAALKAMADDADGERLPTENEVWHIIQSMLDKHGLVRHQIESFNAFILFTYRAYLFNFQRSHWCF